MSRQIIAAVLLLMVPSSLISAEPGPSKEIPELKPLNNWAGAWTGIIEKPSLRTGPSNGRWIAGGRYLQQTWSLEADNNNPALSATVIMTWDVTEKVYRQWQFMSDGTTTQATGQWDAKSHTMTWTDRRSDGGTIVTKARFPTKDLELWSISGTDSRGNEVFKMSGSNKRQKE